ncbi:calcium-binding protein [Celeribacter sp. ULVN23_4]
MLWALAMLGLAPAAFALTEMAFLKDADDEAADEALGGQSEAPDTAAPQEGAGTGDLLDAIPGDDGDVSQETVEAVSEEEATDAQSSVESEVEAASPDELDEREISQDMSGDDISGEDYEVSKGSGETFFADFTEGEDHVTLTVGDGLTGDFIVESLTDEAGNALGISLSYATEEDETILSFLGADTLPVADISVESIDPENGESAVYELSELGDFGATAPNDPEEPDAPGPEGSSDEVVITVNDPERPDEAGPVGDAEGEAITPNEDTETASGTPTGEVVEYVLGDEGETLILADDAMQGGTDASLTRDEDGAWTVETKGTLNLVVGGDGDDVIATGDDAAIVDGGAGNDTIYGGDGMAILSGGDGNDEIHAGNDTGSAYVLSGDAGADRLYGGDGEDTLVMDAEDTVTGGAGADVFWLSYDANLDDNYAKITDFAVGEDILHVTLDPDASSDGAMNVEVRETEDGLSSQVLVNGELVALLEGAPGATVDDIVVEISPTALSAA